MSTSLFEIIGPVMVGPSSSHTAGMARIGRMAHAIAGFSPRRITLRLSPTLSTTYRGHRTDAALVGGALGLGESDPQLRRALELAGEQGCVVAVKFYPAGICHPNTAQLEMESANGETVSVRGVSVGGGSLVIEAVDEQPLVLAPELCHVLVWGTGAREALCALWDSAAVQGNGELAAVSLTTAPSPERLAALRAQPCLRRLRLVEPVLLYGGTVSETLRFTRCDQLVACCQREGIGLAELAQRYEEDRSGRSREEIRALMRQQLQVMKASAARGVQGRNVMLYGLTSGEDGARLLRYAAGESISGGIVPEAVARALGVMEYNASMGCIVAAPTAGSAGIVPGCMVTLQERRGFSDEQVVDALFVSALLGVVMSHREISFSGSVGGCQGEVGVSSAIAAAGIASLFSARPQVPLEAMALCLKNLLGLVCDPVAGPVEVPCIKRNAVGVANAFISADMAVAGIESYLPPDQVMDALLDVERRLPGELRCSTTGGLACAEKAVCLRQRLSGELAQCQPDAPEESR